MILRTRFAPSPTGPLHLGHAYSALLAHDLALSERGEFLLRIEDIDQTRSRPEWEEQIYDDLGWLGLQWGEPVMRQCERMPAYTSALADLQSRGLLYSCTCNRRDIAEALSAPQQDGSQELDPQVGPDGLVYPGTCRHKPHNTNAPNAALRLDMRKVAALLPKTLTFNETGTPVVFSRQQAINGIGDIVLARREIGTSYHLAVVLDDAAQDITHVIRGLDLFEATKIHVILQHILKLPTPAYRHHKLICDDVGKRLAKRDDARAISKYRADGLSLDNIRELVGL